MHARAGELRGARVAEVARSILREGDAASTITTVFVMASTADEQSRFSYDSNTFRSCRAVVWHANDHLKTKNSRTLATMPDKTASR